MCTGLPRGLSSKESASQCRRHMRQGFNPGLERSPGGGKGSPLQYTGLENSMDSTVHGVAKSWTQLSGFHFHFLTPMQASLVAHMVKNLLQCRRLGFRPWFGKIPWRRTWQPTPVFLFGELHGPRSLVGYSPWGRKESDTTEQLTFSRSHFRWLIYFLPYLSLTKTNKNTTLKITGFRLPTQYHANYQSYFLYSL